VLDGTFDGCREHHRLAIGRHSRHDSFDGGQESHIEHTVSLVQDEYADLPEIDELPAEEIAESARRGEQHLRALSNGVQLGPLADAADYNRGVYSGAGGHFDERFVNLHGEFTGRSQDHAADAGLRRQLAEEVDQRQYKRQCLAGAGLRGGNQVGTGQRGLDGLGLHGS